MRTALKLLCAALLVPLILTAQNSRLTGVEPGSAKIGDTATASGENIDKSKVAKLYLTDGKVDIVVAMMEQTDTAIKFKVPANVKPGRYALMIETKGSEARMLEQPVKITIE
jgi:hypothetical protein